jgi:glycosyltransferase involved in cell wall biosynthesis
MRTEFNKAPKVSVVMTTLQSERFVHEAVQSIIDQSWRDFELIIVDGGSSDTTVQKIASFNDSRIIFLNCKGLRRSAQLNVGIRRSHGELIAIMDSDDVALPDRLMLQVEFLESHRMISIVGSWAQFMSAEGEPIGRLIRPVTHESIIAHLLAMNGVCFGTAMFRREVFDVIGSFEESLTLSEDTEWFLRGVERCQFANIPKHLMRLRQTTYSRSRLTSMQNSQLVQSLSNTLLHRLNSPETRAGKAVRERDKGLVHYYFGDMRIAREHFVSSFLFAPFKVLTLRYLIVSTLIPQSLLVSLRQNSTLRKVGMFFRKAAVWKDVLSRRHTA